MKVTEDIFKKIVAMRDKFRDMGVNTSPKTLKSRLMLDGINVSETTIRRYLKINDGLSNDLKRRMRWKK